MKAFADLFQFHKVQLTLIPPERHYTVNKFQFHKVQLTRDVTIKYTITEKKFQFHKVQLTLGQRVNDIRIIVCFNSIRYN